MNVSDLRKDVLACILDADADTLQQVKDACRKRPRPRRLGTAKAAAAIIGVHVRTLDRLERRGLVNPIRVGKRLRRFDLDEIERLTFEGGEG